MAKLTLILKGRPIWALVVAVALALYVGGTTVLWVTGVRPLLDINDGILAGVITALGLFITGLGLLLASMWQRIGKVESDLQNALAEVAKLRGEVEAVRGEKRDVVDKLTAAATFINWIGLWLRDGQKGPLPQPPEQILPHINAELWESDAPGGTDD